ncbi:hypothetical protein PsorP6_015851 [Peronosclerospora sorghi]|uniref:Uncharacterized protein n=1 Tax=Peronosclerospora sorghi TaxID=230839 RepID=A0ACC0WQR4_9STRA|nr:hypothetical protein PsorP6_015851 [Peronosclerospora sorghi]
MAPNHDIEVKGVTTFTETPTTSYRYVLKLKRDKLCIWMEDRTSKKQWCFRLRRVCTFEFVLDPVSVTQVDLLESKLRDQQDELERLRGEVVAHIERKSLTRCSDTDNIFWNQRLVKKGVFN